ncbi:MAG: hypothetical protein PHR39_07220 [Actinomycetota bacterium]|nr:hypothetical protein [Actinomycetota bacterium]
MQEILKNIRYLKKLTSEQNKALLEENFNDFYIINEDKLKVKEYIESGLKNFIEENRNNAETMNSVKMLFDETLGIEKSNHDIIQHQLREMFREKTNINLYKEFVQTYFSSLTKSLSRKNKSYTYDKIL